ncbi:MAG: hypothetical protein Q8O30_04930 [Candidatus Omnitrophota bacterium]|nr:hypothetical protein [Candidatus Omnitrophota bacterium]
MKKCFVYLCKLFLLLILLPVLSLTLTNFAFSQHESITITTYYPAPFGVYNQLVTSTLGVGDNNASGGLDDADAPNPATHPGDVWIAGHLGIATTNPQNRLDVNGSSVIGAAYAGAQAAPANGLLVEGDVGIGVTNPDFTLGADLVVSNTLRLTPSTEPQASVVPEEPVFDKRVYYDVSLDRLLFLDGSTWRAIGGPQVPPSGNVSVANPQAVFYGDVVVPFRLVYQVANGWNTIGDSQPLWPVINAPPDPRLVFYDAAAQRLVYQRQNGSFRVVRNNVSAAPLVFANPNLEGAMYYDTNAHLFKYYDGFEWKEISGLQWGDVTDLSDRLDGDPAQNPGPDATVNCDDGYVATEVFLNTRKTCTKSGCTVLVIEKIGLHCQRIVN